MEKSKTALGQYILKLKKEFGENIIKNCPPDDEYVREREQIRIAYESGANKSIDRKLQTLSEYASDYYYKIYGEL